MIMSNAQDQGFVIEPRSTLNNEWYTEPITMHLYRHCRLRANYTDTEWHGIKLKCGQFVTSLSTLSNETGLSIQQVRTALNKLELTGYITNYSTNKNRIITVLDYYGEQFGNKQLNKQITSYQQATNKQLTTDNNINNKTSNIVEQSPTAHSSEIKTVVEYLNKKAGTNYKPSTKDTRRHINARLTEGYSVDNFKTVIDSKCAEWLGTDNQKYLRPQTLFGSKFESYLNAANMTAAKSADKLLDELKRGYNRK